MADILHAISDDEIVVRRIPPQLPWFEPPDRVSTANFKLDRKRNETGISVYRLSLRSAAEVLALPEAVPGSLVASARVSDIRALTNAANEPLLLDVVADDDDGRNVGHAEIRGPQVGRLSPGASRALQRLFQLCPLPMT